MRVYISIDMEGIGGVATADQVRRGGSGYVRAQELMTDEANAAIAGAFDAGATEVTVNDSHGTMDNLLHDRLDERARVIFGTPKAQCMTHGLSADFDLAMFVGYHAAEGEPGVLAHSFSSLAFAAFRLNGEVASEARVNAIHAASCGVPVGLVSGDDVTGDETRRLLPDAEAVTIKKAAGYTAADSVHPAVARASIREAAAKAVANTDRTGLARVPDQLVLEVEMVGETSAELASLVPGAVRTGSRTVRRDVDSPAELLGLITVWSGLAVGPERARSDAMQRGGR